MFRQIRIQPDDQDLQRILWTPSPEERPVDYRLKTVSYGTTCAPYLAIRTLAQLASDESRRFPLGTICLQHNTYVDDIFAGAHDLELASKKRNELCELLKSAGIELDKWAENQPELLPSRTQLSKVDKHIASNESVKTLGLRWNPATDTFGFSVTALKLIIENPTKRSILSSISQLFDSLGWLAPITVAAKILIQDLWILKCDWDSPLPHEIIERWDDYRNSIASVSSLSISRWLGSSLDSEIQIHGFADASSRAYAAAVYLRLPIHDGQFRVSLLTAKSKVSPVKTMSIPNLELSAAALLVKLICHIKGLPFFKKLPVYAWSDSQIVLAWLRKHPCHWKTFVANRVSFIQTELPSTEWRHVPTKENPADLATRGVKPSELKLTEIWWHGPRWLTLHSEEWPKHPDTLKVLHIQGQSDEPEILTRFSCLTRLIRVVAYCRRPLVRLHNRKIGKTASASFLTTSELADARIAVIRFAQAKHFPLETALLNTKGSLPKGDPLRKLNPFVGKEDGVLRVGGRLSHANLSREIMHPPILPYSSALSRLFAHRAHLSSLHGGPTLTLSLLLRNVWIVSRSRLVKNVIRNCITCQRVKPHLASQLMGDLPKDGVTPSRPFNISGLDYAGPIQIRTTRSRGHRSYKGYIALFVCFTTRAIHLEVVSDLTTASFLAAYRRFIVRRGICRRLYSDNSTTFQGAARELREMFDAASKFYGEVATILANEGTDWTFIPPNTPHSGGLWEAGVKSAKHHLNRMIADYHLTFEELSTVLVEIEACLNSRPLSPLTNELDDLSALTPAHFLAGGSLGLLPDAGIPEVAEHRLTRFQLIQRIRENFWKRWSSEYLHHLQERSKLRNLVENVSLGQLVLVKDERYPPSKWPLGRVIEVHPGPDGLVRVATVQMATTTLRRHVVRLCPLSLPS